MTTATTRRDELNALVAADKKAYLEAVKNFCDTFVEAKIAEAVAHRENSCRIEDTDVPYEINYSDIWAEVEANGFKTKVLSDSFVILW